MKNESTYAKKFTTLWKKIKAAQPNPLPALAPIDLIVVSFLEWNSTRSQALRARGKLMAELIDLNDLRVSHQEELVRLIGVNYPRAAERVARMHEVLHEVYLREHGMSLDGIEGKTKKVVKTYIDTLPGITPYVASQVLLLGFGGHAVPVDDRMVELLRAEGCVDEEATVEEVSAFLERQIKAADAVESHHLLRAWVDATAGAASGKSSPRSAAKSTTAAATRPRKSTKKSTPKPSSTTKKTTKAAKTSKSTKAAEGDASTKRTRKTATKSK